MKKGIVVHCSDSSFGSSIEIDRWHRENGWDNVGYHFVICNGNVENNTYLECMNGAIERGRDIDKSGAHTRGYNHHIGICLVGIDKFTHQQFASLRVLILELKRKYNIEFKDILGHNMVSSKTCPNFDMVAYIKNII